MAKERRCFVCLKTYTYCPNCQGYDPAETWKFLVHDKTCLELYNLWQSYRGGEISKDDAATVLKSFDLTNILASGSPVVDVFKEILDIKDTPKIEEVLDEPKVETKVENKKEDVKTEEKTVKSHKQFNHKK